MRRSLIHRPPTVLGPAWWCQLLAHQPDSGQSWERFRGHLAPHPESALVWMRSEVRTLASGFGPDDVMRAYSWLDHGQWEAIHRLRAGEHYTFDAAMSGARVELSIRRVLPLPRASLRPSPATSCSTPADCPCVEPGHRCGPPREGSA